MIRTLDIILSCLGLIVLGFFLPAIWILLRLDSKGPLFYLADRVGKDQKPFKMFKFRTMLDTPDQVGECLCPQFDPRVTSFGRFLRRTKINELPQMINILKGDMSFVGPRPESPELAEVYPNEARNVFSVKPGLVGPATIHGRNEEECYPVNVDVKQYYLEHLLPSKLKLELKFIQRPGLANYFKFLLLGVIKTITGVISHHQIKSSQPQIYLLIVDLILIITAYLFAYNLFILQSIGFFEIVHSTRYLPLVIVVRLICNQYFGLYRPLLKYLSTQDIFQTVKSNSLGTIILLFISYLIEKHSYSLLIASLDWFALNITSAGLRLALMMYFQQNNGKSIGSKKSRILIFGACDKGNDVCRFFNSESDYGYEVVGFIDDAVHNYGKTLNRKKVLGNRYNIRDLAKLYNIDLVVIADSRVAKKDIIELIGFCAENKLKCGVLSNKNGFNCNYIKVPVIRDIEISDVLSLKRIQADYASVEPIISGKTVLIDSLAGVLGIELCKKFIRLGCKKIIVVERHDSYINEFVYATFSDNLYSRIVPVLVDSDRIDMLEKIFSEHRPSIVIKAEIRKFAPLFSLKVNNLEKNSYYNNFGLAKLAVKYNCENFVMISSIYSDALRNEIDKPLRSAEVKLEAFFSETSSRLIFVRLADIAENPGGVFSLIESQLKNRKTIILPEGENKLKIISNNSAAEAILISLIEAKKEISAKRVFFFNAGEYVLIYEIAKKLASLYNLKICTFIPSNNEDSDLNKSV